MNVINQYTKMCIGRGSLDILKNIKDSAILIITDEFMIKSKTINKVTENIDKSNIIKIFDKVKPDPSIELVTSAMKDSLEISATHIIGFGGGSAIDAAKGVIYFLKESNSLKKDIEFIAIPTTSGTGSEVTSVTVITDEEKQTKHLFESEYLLPDIAVLDADFTISLPPSVVANTGMDVFTHILEAYVANGANDFSDAFAEKAGELVVKYLYRSYINKDDYEAKEKMHIASNMAGHSFNIAGLGLNHSIAHQIGGFYHITHGVANSILLREVIDYNSKDNQVRKKYIKFAKKTGIAADNLEDELVFKTLKNYISSMMILADIPQRISQCNIEKKQWDENKKLLAQNSLKDNCLKSNPVGVDENEIIKILDNIY